MASENDPRIFPRQRALPAWAEDRGSAEDYESDHRNSLQHRASCRAMRHVPAEERNHIGSAWRCWFPVAAGWTGCAHRGLRTYDRRDRHDVYYGPGHEQSRTLYARPLIPTGLSFLRGRTTSPLDSLDLAATAVSTSSGVQNQMTFGPLVLKRASASRPTGEWNDEDYDVLADGAVVGRIMKKVHAAPVGTRWMWTLAFGHHENRRPTHGYEATRLRSDARGRGGRFALINRVLIHDELRPCHSALGGSSRRRPFRY